jgi:peptide/nickel transport system substrate-binding protein
VDRKSYGSRRRALDGLLTRSAFIKLGGAGIAGAALLGAAGCGGQRGGGQQGSGQSSGGTPQKGGTLVFGVDAISGNSDPAIFSTFGDWMVIDCIARGLTHIDYKTTEVKPGMAESWEISDDQRIYTFKLRDGMTFHDGNPVTAEDCVRTFTRLMDEDDPSRPPGTYSIAELGGENVKEVRAVDERTFEVTLQAPDVAFLSRLSNCNGTILSAAAIDKFGKKIGNNLVGAGPFKLVDIVPGQKVELEAFGEYWDGRPNLDRVVLQVLPDPSALNSALQSGQVQVSNFVPPSNVERLGQSLRVEEAEPYIDVFVGMNVAVPLLKDLRVRQAINYCIDRDAIVQEAFSGQAKPPAGLISPPELGYDESLSKYSTQDVDRARSLIQEAGADGESVNLTNQNILFWPKIGQILEQNFKDAGLTLNVEYLDEATYNARQYDPEGHELFVNQRSAFVPDPDNKLSPLLAGDSFVNEVQTQNYLLPSQKKLDELLSGARQETNENRRAELYRELQVFLQEEVMVFAMLAYVALPTVTANNVSGVNAAALGTYRTFLEKVTFTE